MARRGLGQLTREQPVGKALWLTLVLLGCGNSSLKVRQADAGSDVGIGTLGGASGATGGTAAPGRTRVMGGSPIAGASSAAGMATGGMSATVGTSSIAGNARTGGATDGLGGTAGMAGTSASVTTRAGGSMVIGGSASTGGWGGRTTLGGSSIVVITAGNTGGTVRGGGMSATGGTNINGGTSATGGRGGSGGASSSGGAITGGAGGGTGGVGGSGGSTSAATFQALAEAFCAAARRCCARDPYVTVNLTDCESKFSSRLDSVPLVDKGTVLVDESVLAACVSAYRTTAVDCATNPVKAACKGLFLGLQAEGQVCGGTTKFGAVECKPTNSSAICYRPQASSDPKSAGTCVSVPHGKAGDACSMTCQPGKTCFADLLGETAPFPAICFEEDGLFCSMATNPPVCKPLLKTGDVCKWEGNSCGTGNGCGWPDPTCVPSGRLGESCEGRACADGLICGTNKKCIDRPFATDSICQGTPPTP